MFWVILVQSHVTNAFGNVRNAWSSWHSYWCRLISIINRPAVTAYTCATIKELRLLRLLVDLCSNLFNAHYVTKIQNASEILIAATTA